MDTLGPGIRAARQRREEPSDVGAISLYHPSCTLLAAKTRAFVDLVAEAFKRDRLAERLAGSGG
ncbi:hypothetical protein HMPREF9946_02542 [Acetobacteraceae bacterium AT-5844]|nr:hypothetical protein HMPREF9946_02542 [Acetobacteraceae bacterium AT-5844]